jgi:hypothetical protein
MNKRIRILKLYMKTGSWLVEQNNPNIFKKERFKDLSDNMKNTSK